MKKLIMAAIALGGVIWVAKAIKSGIDNQTQMNKDRINQINMQS